MKPLMYKIGSKLPKKVPDCHYTMRNPYLHELVMGYDNPKPEEVYATQYGPIKFAIKPHRDVIFLLFNIGGKWSDAPFNWHFTDYEPREILQDIPTGTGSPLILILADSDTRIIKAIRTLGLFHEFSVTLHKLITEQSKKPIITPEEYDRQVQEAYQIHPTSKAMVGDCVAFCEFCERT